MSSAVRISTAGMSLARGVSAASGLSPSNSIVNKPAIIEYKNYRFLIMDAPTESNLFAYVEMLKKKHVMALVRACEPTYNKDVLTKAGIRVLEAPFDDGDPPSDGIIDQWLELVHKEFGPPIEQSNGKTKEKDKDKDKEKDKEKETNKEKEVKDGKDDEGKGKGPMIAVHCVAGLGRAPILVAIALMEAGMPPLDVINFVRKRRRGAFNSKQLKYIQEYKTRRDKKGNCSIM